MKKKKITSTDIASVAGVSQATVSMILNKKYSVSFSKETVEKVERAAAELGYNIPKRRIHKSKQVDKIIVVFCPTITNPYYAMLMQGIEEVAKEKGYGILVCNTQRDLKIEENYLKLMRTLRPLGIIYTCDPSFPKELEGLSKNIPVVVIGNRPEGHSFDVVELNNRKPGILMARHLIDLGHKKVVFVTPPLTKRQQARIRRVEGFIEEFRKEGLEDNVIIKCADDKLDLAVPKTDSEYRMGYSLTKELLKETRDFTAIAGLNDLIALGVIDALLEEKYKVPGDISVLGCDNIVFGRLREVGLTTIEHYVPLKGRDACDIVVKKIQSQDTYNLEILPTSTYHIEYEPKLMPRKTSAYAKRIK
jgi:Transcriptional regulators